MEQIKPRIVIQLDAEGGDPTITADGSVEIVQLRQGKDLKDYDEDDIIELPSKDLPGRMDDAVGGARDVQINIDWVSKVFEAIERRDSSHAENR